MGSPKGRFARIVAIALNLLPHLSITILSVKILSRREALRAVTMAGLGLAAGGHFWRSARGATNVPTTQPHLPLALAFTVYKLAGKDYVPMTGATVDVWHAAAARVYSDEDNPMNPDSAEAA